MQRALTRLEEDGLLFTNRTSGKFVTEDVTMIQQAKNKLAQEQVQEFLKKMTDLGLDDQEILSILKAITEELKK
jgi:DNA-binding transcriptional regulator YhcF (GntR family)